MAWGQAGASGVADLVDRLNRNDPTLSSLTILRFRKFGPTEAASLCEALKKNTTLTELIATGHKLSGETAKTVAAMLATNATLTSLCVGDMTFGDEGVAGLAPGLRGNRALRRLDLENKAVTAAGAADLASVLAESGVRELLMQKNHLHAAGAEALLRGGACRLLTSLDLSFCGMDGAAAAHVASGLLCEGSPLETCVLEGNPFGPAGVATLAAALGNAARLRDLNLAGTEAGDDGIRALAEGPLRSCAALRKLSLARCRAGPASGAHLASAAASSGFAVENLDLGGNSLADGGATALAEALRDASSGPALSLDLTSNEIRGADAAAALGRARRLRGLELFNNAIGDAGAAALAEALGTESKLALLNLGATSLGIVGVRSLFAVLRAGSAPALDTLEVSANDDAMADDSWDSEIAQVREARPELDVAWKAADSGVGAGGGPPPPEVQAAMDAARLGARAG